MGMFGEIKGGLRSNVIDFPFTVVFPSHAWFELFFKMLREVMQTIADKVFPMATSLILF